jgi:ribosomal protein S25
MINKTSFTTTIELIQKAMNTLPQELFDQSEGRIAINKPTGNFFYSPWEIKEEFKNTVWEELYNSLDVSDKGEARIIRLNAGESYISHADIDDRYHLNLSGINCFLIDLDNRVLHELDTDGIWYNMNAGRIHTAANFGNRIRLQLVVRKLLNKVELKNSCPVKITVNDPPYNLRYLFDHSFSIVLNRLNKQGCMNKFKKISETEIYFEIEQTHLPQVNKLVDTCGFDVRISHD